MQTKSLPEIEDVGVLTEEYDLVVHNDDVHTFDFVIETLIDICSHEYHQAVQCTYIIHHNGKCAVKRGGYEKLKPLCDSIRQKGLSATIE